MTYASLLPQPISENCYEPVLVSILVLGTHCHYGDGANVAVKVMVSE